MTHIDELDLPDLLDQLHGGVAVDEEGLGVVAELQRLEPLGHRRRVVAIVTDGSHLQHRERSDLQSSVFTFVMALSSYWLSCMAVRLGGALPSCRANVALHYRE